MFRVSAYDRVCPLPVLFIGAEVGNLLRSDIFIVLVFFCFVLCVHVCFDNSICRPCVEGRSGFLTSAPGLASGSLAIAMQPRALGSLPGATIAAAISPWLWPHLLPFYLILLI